MRNFEFYTPTRIFFGRKEEEKIGEIIREYGFRKVLIHYGGGSVIRSGLLKKITDKLDECGIEYITLGGVQPNPLLSMVRRGIALCRAEQVDLILAVGGGSAMDSAKAIADGTANPETDVWDMISKKVPVTRSMPVATVLTIAASGSEMSNSCVITNDETKQKRGYGSPFHRPLFSILDPELTFTVGPYQTACGIVDIMMHTLERYFSATKDTELTDRIAEALLKSVMHAGTKAMQDPEDYEARATLMWAGSLSHNDLTGAGRFVFMPVHQIEHELSGWNDKVSHGAGLSALFPAWCRFIVPYAVEDFAQYAVRVFNIDMNFDDPMETALAGIRATEDYFRSLKMPVRISELGFKEEELEQIADNTVFHGARTLPDYIELGKEEILTILRMAM